MSHVDGVDDGVGYGVYGKTTTNVGVVGESDSGYGVYGLSNSRDGAVGFGPHGSGVRGESNDGHGVVGTSNSGFGVHGVSIDEAGMVGEGVGDRSAGVVGISHNGGSGMVAVSRGTYIRGPLQKPGGSFKIDHPLDPANKYLSHSFVESPDMKNIYDGVVILDNNGEAEIDLPDWFTALNKDYRYQITAIGAPGPNLYIAKEIPITSTDYANPVDNINNNHSSFRIAGGTSGMKN